MGTISGAWYRHAGGAMLRAAALPLHAIPAAWPALSDPASCRSWLRSAWATRGFAEATRYASGSFADLVEAVLNQKITNPKQVRRVTMSTVRYLLRSAGRPTPFGLFAGVAPVRVGDHAKVAWGADHRVMVRADTLWLDDVVERLEALPGPLERLDVVVSDLVVDRGDRIEMPRGPGRVSIRNTAVVRLVRNTAATPITFRVLSNKVAEEYPGTPLAMIHQTLASLVTQGMLITNLRAPMTVTDPLNHVIKVLDSVAAGTNLEQVGTILEQLRDIQTVINAHNTAETGPDTQAALRETATERMRDACPAGRTTLAGDLHLDCRITVSEDLAEEMAHAATALLRLTRQPRPDQAWNDWCREFWERYGTGALVPVTEAVHPDAGIGWPAGFPASMMAEPDDAVSSRDTQLFRLVWEAVTGGRGEVVLTDEIITAITADEPVDTRWIPPHVELAARVHAASERALSGGDYTFTVHPAQAFGTLTSRFGHTVTAAGLDATYATTPPGVDGALSVQMSFPPLYPHSENVARIPAYLPHVLPLGEHHTDEAPSGIPLHDLGIVAVADGLHLVSISRRRIIEPQVFHALALGKQAPPLARFLATLTRGFWARYTELDWGPLAAALPYLPRVRYRRAVLSPATWQITAADHTAMTGDANWDNALTSWRRRWNCPDTVELHDDHRSLRLTLTVDAHRAVLRAHLNKHGHVRLTETESTADSGWVGGHVHEVVMPFTRATPPTPNLLTGPLPLVGNSDVAHHPAAPRSSWLYAQVFTHPERIDDIIRAHLPRLLAMLDSDPAYWFARYRSVRETDHLRLRIRTRGPDEYAATALVIGAWGQQLCDLGAASRCTLATYHPEVGRYGNGAAIDAAEAAFVADSHAVALAFQLLPPRVIHPIALTTIGMVDIADAFLADPNTATGWLLEHLATKAAATADRAIADQVGYWVVHRRLPDGAALPAALAEAWRARRDALARYRQALPEDASTDQVLSALLHMHHNRARSVDRADEATCLRLARQLALARRARPVGSIA